MVVRHIHSWYFLFSLNFLNEIHPCSTTFKNIVWIRNQPYLGCLTRQLLDCGKVFYSKPYMYIYKCMWQSFLSNSVWRPYRWQRQPQFAVFGLSRDLLGDIIVSRATIIIQIDRVGYYNSWISYSSFPFLKVEDIKSRLYRLKSRPE